MLRGTILAALVGAVATAHGRGGGGGDGDLSHSKLVPSSEQPLNGSVTIFTVWASRANSTRWSDEGYDAIVHNHKCQLCNQVR